MEPRTYYSRCGAYQICAEHGKIVEVDGKNTRLPDVIIGFTPMGSATFKQPDGTIITYGSYVTSDQKEIDFLENHIKTLKDRTGQTDVLTAEMFQAEIVPAEKRAESLKEKLERQIETNNRLMAQLAEAQKHMPPKPQPGQVVAR